VLPNSKRRLITRRRPCPPWTPTADPYALTIENLERCSQRALEAPLAEALAADSDSTNPVAFKLIRYAWDHLDAAGRAHLLTVALTPEVRATIEHERGWR
jgi:hypothetical protein